MTIRWWKNYRGETQCVTNTDCYRDAGLEQAWKVVTKILDNGFKKEDVEKAAKAVRKTNKDSNYNERREAQIGVRAAERYCLGKILSGETENPRHSSGKWEPLKEQITPEFYRYFKIEDIYNSVMFYFKDVQMGNKQTIDTPEAAFYYGPSLYGYVHDLSKGEAIDVARKNIYISDSYKKEIKDAKENFENEIKKVDLKKYKITTKDEARVVDLLNLPDDKYSGKLSAQVKLIKSPEKAVARYTYSVKYGNPIRAFANKAMELGVTAAELEAYSRAKGELSTIKCTVSDSGKICYKY